MKGCCHENSRLSLAAVHTIAAPTYTPRYQSAHVHHQEAVHVQANTVEFDTLTGCPHQNTSPNFNSGRLNNLPLLQVIVLLMSQKD